MSSYYLVGMITSIKLKISLIKQNHVLLNRKCGLLMPAMVIRKSSRQFALWTENRYSMPAGK